MINRKELKATAKMRMSQTQPSYLKVMLLWVLAAVIIPQIVSTVASSPISLDLDRFYMLIEGGIDPWMAMQSLQMSSAWITVSLVLSIVLTIYQSVLGFGLSVYSLNLYRDEPCGPSDLFSGFSIAGRVIGAQLLIVLFAFLWFLVLVIPFSLLVTVCAMVLQDAFIVPFIALYILLIAGLIAILLRYALVSFALADDPNLGALGAIQRSKDLMRGYKWEYFKLEFSFFGWILLCMLPYLLFSGVTVGISFSSGFTLPIWADSLIMVVLLLPYYLWLAPYLNATTAGFYETLSGGPAPNTQPWQPPLPPEM